MKILVSLAVLLGGALPAVALDIHHVAENTYALVGSLDQRAPENLGNNATFGVVVTSEGVVLIDAGGSWLGAMEIDALIDEITDQPVVIVINSGGQDHRWISNDYWQQQGAQIIASTAAVADQQARGSLQMTVLNALIGDKLAGTSPVYADTTFDSDYDFTLGGVDFEIRHIAQAHTPGDSFIWLPATRTVFTGDIVYVDRILGIGDQSHSGTWIDVFEEIAALNPIHLVPGHGPATTMEHATADTYDYLVNLRAKMGAYIDDGGDIIDSVNVDQSAFSYLANFDRLAKRNAQQVFTEMEWE
ncbi:MAG: MBL fold metallo-hydrolase [Rhodobacteraceae bacterium]|nr:MBL fold metallo-hydrolase [Paracoccaceae bacterium]